MTVTFCGHKEVGNYDQIQRWLREVVADLIAQGADEFLLGGYGGFDLLAAGVVREAKAEHPHIRSLLVIPYLDRVADGQLYDGSVYPPLESVPKRYAISHRNRWMVEQADVVVAYVEHDWGGAAATLKHARRKKRRVVQFDPSVYH